MYLHVVDVLSNLTFTYVIHMFMRTCHSSDVHLGQVPGLEDDDGEAVDGGRVAERHQHLTAASRLHLVQHTAQHS